jgi:hypothetical protein
VQGSWVPCCRAIWEKLLGDSGRFFGGDEKGHCHRDPCLRLAGAGKMGKAYKIDKLKKEKNFWKNQ